MSASHSTDLQQRAYELQALLGLDNHAVESVMPSDASCEDIEVDRSLAFLDTYVRRSIENGARPYIPESERSRMLEVGNLEASHHSLKFEAYELPVPTADLVPMPVPTHSKKTYQGSNPSDSSLRLEGVEKKWGVPSYSSRENSHDTRKQQMEASTQKQRLAASLFGSSSSEKNVVETAVVKTAPSDLVDLGEPATENIPIPDPFTQLESLIPSSPPLLYGPEAITRKGSNARDSLVKDAIMISSGRNPNLFVGDLLG